MMDDEQTPEEIPEETSEETPAAEAPEETPGEPEETPEPEAPQAPEEPAETEEPAPAAEAPAEEEPAPAAEEKPAEQKPAEKKEKPAEAVPGAELDPIALEPERELSAEEKARLEAEAEEKARQEADRMESESDDAPVAAKPAKLSSDARYQATGKRKSSVARVLLTPGDGKIQVNDRSIEEYFPRPYLQTIAKQALVQAGYEGNVDVSVRVHGGGISGQASAVRHGIAKALTEVNPDLRIELKRRGMLTRDARVKERRKAGLKKARKRPQFSKR